MTPEEVREIVRDEVTQMLIKAGIVEALNDLLTGTLAGDLMSGLVNILPRKEAT